jgi:hypothetical protein
VRARLDPPPAARAALNGLRAGALAFTLGFSDVNQPQTITAPSHALPLSTLVSVLQKIGVTGGAAGSGATGAGAATTTTTTTATSTPSLPAGAAPPAYLRCYEQAGNDLRARQRCAPLLNGH